MIASRMVEVVVLLLVASLPSILLAQGQNPDPAQEAQKTEARRTQLNQLIGTVKRIATTPPSPQDRQTPMVRKTGQEYLYSLSAPPGAQAEGRLKRSPICS